LFFAKAGVESAKAPMIAAHKTGPKDIFIFKPHTVTYSLKNRI
jgi:hypothetical protein